MITARNYFEASYGTFKSIPRKWVQTAVEAVSITEDYGVVDKRQTEIVLGNHKWVPNFVSVSGRYQQSVSAYWISEDGEFLLRISNHWSRASKGSGVFQCGMIRSCYWELDGRPQAYVKSRNNAFWGGIVRISDMSERA